MGSGGYMLLKLLVMANMATAHVLVINPNMDLEQANKVDKVIEQACSSYKLDCKLFKAILAQESMFSASAFNGKTMDYGIGQINRKTASAMGLDVNRLRTDLDYSVNNSAKILAYFQTRYRSKERLWYCRYNIGTKVMDARTLKRCHNYSQLVQRHYKKLTQVAESQSYDN